MSKGDSQDSVALRCLDAIQMARTMGFGGATATGLSEIGRDSRSEFKVCVLLC